MLSKVNTIALEGIAARLVEVEVDIIPGLPSLNIVGLAEGAVREAKDRVRAALANSGYQIPAGRVTVNLAPADLPKGGSAYDLPIAVGILVALGLIGQEAVNRVLLVGELSLDGGLRPVPGVLPAAILVRDQGLGELVVPALNGQEAAMVEGVRVLAPANLVELIDHFMGARELRAVVSGDWREWLNRNQPVERDLSEVRGQEFAKRALELVAAGGHNLLMSGPPGSGKTLLAQCLPGIMPPLALEEALEVTTIYSVAGMLPAGEPLVGSRPFRSPHHTASQAALIGGGSSPRPGEVSLAHRGVLFLDELPEFGRSVLEVLREPLETGDVTIARAARIASFPAEFQLVAACNPCPCGHLGDSRQRCRCQPAQIERYHSRLSGPLLDRIDLQVEVPPVPFTALVELRDGESSSQVRERVLAARRRQEARNGVGVLNAALRGAALDRHARLDRECRQLLVDAGSKLGFSARAFHRILRVARTVADLSGGERITQANLAEAIHFRTGAVKFGRG